MWVRGEHDLATRVELAATIGRAARPDDTGVVVDLSGVTFMDASTIGAIVASRNGLAARGQTLTLRAPSRQARRVLELCAITGLVHFDNDGDAHQVVVHPRRGPVRRRHSFAGSVIEADRGGP